jgi:hypothetical protein
MSYNPAIPASTDLISNSQPQILTNFGQLNTQYLADHDGFNTGSGNGSGMHDQVTFLANQAAPSLTRNGVPGVSGLYANTDGTNSQLFFQNALGSTQMTGPFSATQPGNVTLPGGILLQWGSSNVIGTPVAFASAFTHNIFSLVMTTATGFPLTSVVSSSTSVTGFVARRTDGSSGAINYFYIAIGN